MGREDLTLAIVGDIYVHREDPSSVFRHVSDILSKADIAFGNQEASLSMKGIPRKRGFGKKNMESGPRMVQALISAGFDVVGLANNHSMDWGPEGIMEAIEVLNQAKIAHCGAGANIDEAHKPAIIECNGTKVAFLSYSSVFLPDLFPAQENRPGIAVVSLYTVYRPPARVFEVPGMPAISIAIPQQADLKLLQQDISKARDEADVVVISWHWGVSQGYLKVVDYQREMGKFAIDAGADLVVGHHPHVLQGVEVYKGKAIFYSLGDFTFHNKGKWGRESMIVRCQIRDKQIRGISLVPLLINEQDEPEVVTGKKGEAIYQFMQQLSGPYGTIMEPSNGEMSIGGIS
jgi:poly-gamma-glutamate capsule biosynthesis protein CapA/YwtB (metallophosphatase superfamily)